MNLILYTTTKNQLAKKNSFFLCYQKINPNKIGHLLDKDFSFNFLYNSIFYLIQRYCCGNDVFYFMLC
jgi:hypothetical protein